MKVSLIIIILIILILLTYLTIKRYKGGHGNYIYIKENDIFNKDAYFMKEKHPNEYVCDKDWSFGTKSYDTIYKLLFKWYIDDKYDNASINKDYINKIIEYYKIGVNFGNTYEEFENKINELNSLISDEDINLIKTFKPIDDTNPKFYNNNDVPDFYKNYQEMIKLNNPQNYKDNWMKISLFQNRICYDYDICYTSKTKTFKLYYHQKNIDVEFKDTGYITTKYLFNKKCNPFKLFKQFNNIDDITDSFLKDYISEIEEYKFKRYEIKYFKIYVNSQLKNGVLNKLNEIKKDCNTYIKGKTLKGICFNEISSGSGFDGFDDILKAIKFFNLSFEKLITLEINEKYPTNHWYKSLLSDIRNMININKFVINKDSKYFGSIQFCCDNDENSYKYYSNSYCWTKELYDKIDNKEKIKGDEIEDKNFIIEHMDRFIKNLEKEKYTVYLLNTILKNKKPDDFKVECFDFTIEGIKKLIKFYSDNTFILLKSSYTSVFADLLTNTNMSLKKDGDNIIINDNNPDLIGGEYKSLKDIENMFNESLCNNPDGIGIL